MFIFQKKLSNILFKIFIFAIFFFGQKALASTSESLANEIPWDWYLSRASGWVAYIFLWFSIFLGLSIRNIFLKKIIKPIHSFDFHCFVSISAIFWALFHGISFWFHEGSYFMSFREIFIPLY